MNIDKSAPNLAQQTATVALPATETRSHVIRVLDAEEILHIAGGPETVIGAGVNPPH